MVTLPHVQGVTEPVQRILKYHEIITAVRPHQNILLHPNDKVANNTSYIGDTERTFGTRLDEQRTEVEA